MIYLLLNLKKIQRMRTNRSKATCMPARRKSSE